MKLVLPPHEGLELTAGELTTLRDDVDAWTRAALHEGLPPKAHVRVARTEEHATTTGWPFRLVESEVRTEDDRLLELRAHAFFSFLEHAAVVVARGPHEGLLDVLRGAVPDFSGPVSALAPLFDLSGEPPAEPAPPPEEQPAPPRPPRPSLEEIFRAAKAARGDFAQLAAALAHVDEHLAEAPHPVAHYVRGGILAQLGQGFEAAGAYRQAIELDPGFAEAHFALGLTYADLGRTADAIAAWGRAAEVRPDYLDALYNKAQAHYSRGELAEALATWKAALAHAPEDFFLLKKLAQTQHGLGQHGDAAATHDAIIAAWEKSSDATVRHLSEYVFDQFEVAGMTVHALETLRPPKPDFFAVFSFRVVDAKGQPTGLAAQLETSTVAREKGTPFVLTVVDGDRYRVLGTYDALPSYPLLKQHVTKVLTEATQPRSS